MGRGRISAPIRVQKKHWYRNNKCMMQVECIQIEFCHFSTNNFQLYFVGVGNAVKVG